MSNRLVNFTKNVFSAIIYILGIPLFCREWICRNHVTILLYHDVKPEVFAKHITYLSRHYSIISLNTLVTAIYKKDYSDIPSKSVVITIDDGHAGNAALLPIIREHNIYPTIYVCTQIINTHRHFWFKISAQSKKQKEYLKKLPNAERLTRLKESNDFEPEKEHQDRQALNLHEMRKMMQEVNFQPHTQFHPILPNCTETECRQEILGSKKDLETLLDIECLHFSYPNGDYTEREVEIVKSGRFRSARTTDLGWNNIKTSPYKLKAIPISDNAGLIRFRAELTTIPQRCGKLFSALLWSNTN